MTGYALGVVFGAPLMTVLGTKVARKRMPLQKRVVDQAHGAPTLASVVNIGAFNLGNALSAWLGGMVMAAGLGYTAPNWVGAALAAGALVLAVVSGALERRGSGSGRPCVVVAEGAGDGRQAAVRH
ncbi:putative MFS family arabinose efflux permease [Streptomyces achromogenes]|uniref:MFS family arabinose efflux permease n=1 Tax=Streptomyces achromogenes TaxID=67255 RepID=A0ABU0Q2Q3_STRAH|nr:putative MFS family arabinose efflux permease [Streptomyces achromogenes]